MPVHRLLVGFIISCGLLACSSDNKERTLPPGGETSEDNSVEIVYSSPIESEPLQAGDHVKVEVELIYSLLEPAGQIMVFVQRSEKGMPPILSKGIPITQGTGQLEFAVDFTVPNTNKINIFTPLTAKGTVRSKVVDSLSFDVIR